MSVWNGCLEQVFGMSVWNECLEGMSVWNECDVSFRNKLETFL